MTSTAKRRAPKTTKGPVIVDLEFDPPRGFHEMKVKAINYPQHYGVFLGPGKGWQLPADQTRFLQMLPLLGGKILPFEPGGVR